MRVKHAGFNQYAVFKSNVHIGWVKRKHVGVYLIRDREYSWFPEKHPSLKLAVQALYKEVTDEGRGA